MNGLVHQLSPVFVWLIDYLLIASVLLLADLAALAALRQPVQRLAVTKSALVALAIAAVLCALPGWSVVHLMMAREEVTPPPTISVSPIRHEAPDMSAPQLSDSEPPIQLSEASVASQQSQPLSIPAPAASWSWSELPWLAIAQWLFAAGSSAIVGWLIIGAVAARRLRFRAAPAGDELVDLFRKIAGGPPHLPPLLISNEIDTALALGVFRPAVVLPREWCDNKPPQELATVLTHEWAHIENGDLRWLAASRVLVILLWVQPLYWLLRRQMRLDQEALADAAAADTSGRQQYASELVAWARGHAAAPNAGGSSRRPVGRAFATSPADYAVAR